MKRTIACLLASATAFTAVPALAASDIFIEFDGLDGEAIAVPGPADSWSFGACNAGQCSTITAPRDHASGQASGKSANPTKNNWNLGTLKGARSGVATGAGAAASGVAIAVGDVDGDGLADFAYAGTLDSIDGLKLAFDKSSPVLARICEGKHFDKVVLRVGADTYEITDAAGTCTATGNQVAARRIDSTPARISTNFTVGKQTQTQSFGEKVQSGLAQAGSVVVQFSGGQMKYTKTGHVTLLK